jgi:hypothetical protein
LRTQISEFDPTQTLATPGSQARPYFSLYVPV